MARAQSRLTVTADMTDGNFYHADERNERQLQGGTDSQSGGTDSCEAMFDGNDTDIDGDENEHVGAYAGPANPAMNATLFCHAGLRVPVCVLGGKPHYSVTALLRGLAALRSAHGTSGGSPETLAVRRARRLCETLDDAGVQHEQFCEELYMRGDELFMVLQKKLIRGFKKASTTPGACAEDLVAHMAFA